MKIFVIFFASVLSFGKLQSKAPLYYNENYFLGKKTNNNIRYIYHFYELYDFSITFFPIRFLCHQF